jgi:hypothetical protein
MSARKIRIGIVAPSSRLEASMAERVKGLAADRFPGVELVFHPQCFRSAGHFAGTDAFERADRRTGKQKIGPRSVDQTPTGMD